ncbi:MAG TPA: cytochrome P450 [Acidimicrobiales bacterium]|nr:cytochrome P450 [Acidimicrobiales bacterium]
MTDMSVTTVASETPGPAGPSPELDGLLLELFGTAEGRADPYSRYARMRSEAPLFQSSLGMWVSTRYEDAQMVLRDHRFGKAEDSPDELRDRAAQRFGINEMTDEQADYLRERRSLLFLNPPDHTRLRGLVSKAFTPRTVEKLRPAIGELVDGILDGFDEGEPIDLINALAFPLPVAVIGRMLGVPAADWPQFQEIMREVTVLLEPMVPQDELRQALRRQGELDVYFRALLAERRREPQDDLISHMIAVEEGSDRLTENEVLSTSTLLFGAGFETTTNLIGNGIYSLLTHPDELQRLRDDRDLIRSGVEELLRFDSPVQLDGRRAFEDVEIGGRTIRAGSDVVTLLGAANRDPEHFTDPDRLDVGRDEGPPLSFASGIHYCLGAALARAEGQVVLERLLDRYPVWELATDTPSWRNRLTLRGLTELPVVFTGR